MKFIQRSNRIRREIRRIIFRIPEQKYFISGDKACRKLMQGAVCRRRRKADPEEESILAWARFDLMRETLNGFWERTEARAA